MATEKINVMRKLLDGWDSRNAQVVDFSFKEQNKLLCGNRFRRALRTGELATLAFLHAIPVKIANDAGSNWEASTKEDVSSGEVLRRVPLAMAESVISGAGLVTSLVIAGIPRAIGELVAPRPQGSG